ncbi:MAG: hypothetical protein V3T84_07755 [Phycisphaerales bacterium]
MGKPDARQLLGHLVAQARQPTRCFIRRHVPGDARRNQVLHFDLYRFSVALRYLAETDRSPLTVRTDELDTPSAVGVNADARHD